MLDAFTDYPIECYGDVAGKPAPIRKATILTYDRKLCDRIEQLESEIETLNYNLGN